LDGKSQYGLERPTNLGHTCAMPTRYSCYWLGLAFLVYAFVSEVPAADEPDNKPSQFIYVLRLVPRLYDDKAWTDEDKAALQRHFMRFKHAIETGELILAGRSPEPGAKTFGVAIFQAPDEGAARQFMQSDPAVVAGLMTAELHPFAVALERKNP
jgi:uncharacterized protein YciI